MEQREEDVEQNRIKELVKAGEIDEAYREVHREGSDSVLDCEKVKQAVIEAVSELLGSGEKGEAYEAFWRFELPVECAGKVVQNLVEKKHWNKVDALMAARDLREMMEVVALSAEIKKK